MSREPSVLNDAQRDRAVGALLGTAAGDALGADPALYRPGEWTGNTAMALAVSEIATFAGDLGAPQRLTELVQRWAWWARNAPSVGRQTSAVLSEVAESDLDYKAAPTAAARLYEQTSRTLDGTCLTRAVPAGLANLGPLDDAAAAHAARKLCELTHAGPDAGDACALWAIAIRHAVLSGRLDVRVGLRWIAKDRRELWESRIAQAERSRPADFADRSAGPVGVFQAAWSAIATTSAPEDDPRSGVFVVDHLRLALEAAVQAGGNADIVAATAGGLLGAAYGATAIPWQWRLTLRGWPGLNTHLLVNLVEKYRRGEPDEIFGYGSWRDLPAPQLHPHDDGVWIGVGARLENLPDGVDTVVSLVRVADVDVPAEVRHLEVRLVDEVGANPNLDFVLLDTVRAIEQLRAEGTTVFLHGSRTRSRAPAVAALYGARSAGIDIDQALAEVCAALPEADPNREFRASLRRLAPATERTK